MLKIEKEDVVREALSRVFLEERIKKLKANCKIEENRLRFDPNGKITIEIDDKDMLYSMLTDLLNQLAAADVDAWWKINISKDKEKKEGNRSGF
jgi:KaiC/GvpD/RAD55 family RecA-like ATPase